MKKILFTVLIVAVFVSGAVVGSVGLQSVKAFATQVEVNTWSQIYVPEESDLALALRSAANNNNREVMLHLTFETGDYTGGNDSALFVDVVSAEWNPPQ